MSFYDGLLFFSLLTAVYPLAVLWYIPFIELNKYNVWRMTKYALPVCIATVGIGYILNYYFNFEQNTSTALFVPLPFAFLHYRWAITKFVKVDLYKLLFICCLALHVSSALTVVRMPVNLLAQAIAKNTDQANILIECFMILARIIYFPVMIWVIRRYITPPLKKIEANNIKWLWIIPASFTFISISIYSYHFSQSTHYFILVINVPLNIMSFLIYIVVLNMLDNVMKSTRLKAENFELERSNRMKIELMSNISHEARTPLAVLASYAGLVSIELKNKGVEIQTAANLDKVVLEAKRVAELIDSMNKFILSNIKTPEHISIDIADINRQEKETK